MLTFGSLQFNFQLLILDSQILCLFLPLSLGTLVFLDIYSFQVQINWFHSIVRYIFTCPKLNTRKSYGFVFKAWRCKHNCIFILFTGSFAILIKPNIRVHYDYCNILLHNICIYLIFNIIILHVSSYIRANLAFNNWNLRNV